MLPSLMKAHVQVIAMRFERLSKAAKHADVLQAEHEAISLPDLTPTELSSWP